MDTKEDEFHTLWMAIQYHKYISSTSNELSDLNFNYEQVIWDMLFL
jgi:hypothetical protein